MRIMIAAATVAIAALAVGPASADSNMGGPVKQNGQCWTNAKTMDGGTYGYWKSCPDEASAQATTQTNHRRVRHQ